MHTTIRAARTRRHLLRRERERHARTEAFSRRMPAAAVELPPVSLQAEDLALIDRLVRHDRTALSNALLAIAGIGAGATTRSARVRQRGGLLGAGGGRDQREPWCGDRAVRQAALGRHDRASVA